MDYMQHFPLQIYLLYVVHRRLGRRFCAVQQITFAGYWSKLVHNLNPSDLPQSIASWISDLSTISSAAVTRCCPKWAIVCNDICLLSRLNYYEQLEKISLCWGVSNMWLWAATIAREAVKHSEMVHLLGKFHSRAHNPWLVIVYTLL